ncbi:MAG TPA: hypothetical protein VLG91_20460 [Streptomyces sp.]|jgi:hypothetical protein|nr:hypothetical protein [Streptomyces sp.]
MAAQAPTGVPLVDEAVVAMAGDTAFSVNRDEPKSRPSASAAGD